MAILNEIVVWTANVGSDVLNYVGFSVQNIEFPTRVKSILYEYATGEVPTELFVKDLEQIEYEGVKKFLTKILGDLGSKNGYYPLIGWFYEIPIATKLMMAAILVTSVLTLSKYDIVQEYQDPNGEQIQNLLKDNPRLLELGTSKVLKPFMRSAMFSK